MNILIAKTGFCTRLYNSCNDVSLTVGMFEDTAECYDFETLLSERTGESHDDIIVVAGRHMIEQKENGRYTIWYLNNEEAEPYSTHKSREQAMDELMELEEFTFA